MTMYKPSSERGPRRPPRRSPARQFRGGPVRLTVLALAGSAAGLGMALFGATAVDAGNFGLAVATSLLAAFPSARRGHGGAADDEPPSAASAPADDVPSDE